MVTMQVYSWRGDLLTYYFASRQSAEKLAALFKPERPVIVDGIQLDLFWSTLIL